MLISFFASNTFYMKKIYKYGIIGLILIVVGGWFFVFYFPKTDLYKKITVKKADPTTAIQIVKDFQENEDAAFKKYSGKLIEVSGIVIQSQIENNKTTINLKSNDEMTTVYFLLKENVGTISEGKQITLKGLCTGFLGDVQFNEGEIVK